MRTGLIAFLLASNEEKTLDLEDRTNRYIGNNEIIVIVIFLKYRTDVRWLGDVT